MNLYLKQRVRYHILLDSYESSVRNASQKFGVSPSFIYKWRRRWETEGKKTSKVIEDLFKNDYPTGDYWKREFTSDKFSTRQKGIINVTKLWNGQNGNVISSKGYCNTLLTTGGGEGQKVFVPEKDEIIKLPIIVTARLQGFPEEYNWIVSKSQAYRLIGNAISVNVVRLIAQEIYLMLSAYPPCIVPLINKLKS